jgi:hypothetical protein
MTTTPLKTPMRRAAALAIAAIAVLAACGGNGESASTTEAPSTTRAVTTTHAPTTTEATTTTAATTTTTIPPPTFPLTGLPAPDAVATLRPAIVVKIDNHPDARPQAGLNQADIVYEEIVEGITRFFTIFQSTDAAPVGPIRSARTTDVALLDQLNRPLFVWSGGNGNVVRAIGGANAVSMADGQGPGFYRDRRGRRVATEHTLFNDGTPTIYSRVEAGEGPPAPFFSYRPVGTPSVAGQPVTNIDARMNSVPVQWAWDPAQGLWIRSEYSAPHVDASGAPVSAMNVVVEFVPYGTSPADRRSPEAETVGEGDAWVFTDGKLIFAHWSRPDVAKPAVLTDAGGQPVLLTPGRTWIELAQAGTTEVSYS